MNTVGKWLFFINLTFIGFATPVYSQVSCQEVLNQATAEFEAGRFYTLPSLLKTCLDDGFSKEQRFRAYYLLSQVYLLLDDPIAAQDSYLKLLTVDPEFKPNEKDDPIDLVYLSREFTSRPRFTPHYRIGANVSMPRLISNISTFSSPVLVDQSLNVGIQLGLGVDWNIDDNWSIGAEGNLGTKSFTTSVRNIAQDDYLDITDKSSWIDIPLYLKYSYDSGKWRPYAYAGFALNLLVSSNAELIFRDYSYSVQSIKQIAQGPDEDLSYKRNFLNKSVVFGGGVKYKWGKDFLYVDARYMIGLNNLTIPEKNFYKSDGTLASTITQYQYVSDFFRLDNLSVSFGYVRPIYDPRKKKKASTSGLFRNLFKPKKKN